MALERCEDGVVNCAAGSCEESCAGSCAGSCEAGAGEVDPLNPPPKFFGGGGSLPPHYTYRRGRGVSGDTRGRVWLARREVRPLD